VTEQLAHPEWRRALEATAPLPAPVTLAPPSLARHVAPALTGVLDGTAPAALLVMREYLVPFGCTLARELGARRVVVDLDDDVETLLEARGDADDAAAYRRLARTWLPRVDAVALASPVEATTVARRHDLAHVVAVPNTVTPRRPAVRPDADRLLFVANLSYRPNADAAHVLAEEVLPRVRSRRPRATLELVGRGGEALRRLEACDGVRVHDFLADVSSAYAAADVIALPIAEAAGTRIKILEAFAHARPVVATPAAVAGLAVEHGRDVLVADAPDALADGVVRVLGDRALADRLAAAGARTLHDHYAPDVVAAQARRVVLGEQAGAAG
jgi:glycosyltransferase involved in cell wall biosynthesis